MTGLAVTVPTGVYVPTYRDFEQNVALCGGDSARYDYVLYCRDMVEEYQRAQGGEGAGGEDGASGAGGADVGDGAGSAGSAGSAGGAGSAGSACGAGSAGSAPPPPPPKAAGSRFAWALLTL